MKISLKFALVLMTICTLALSAMTTRADDKLHVRPRYLLKINDVLVLEYRYTPEFNQTITIQPDGYVNLNIAGQIRLTGMTVEQAHDAILERVGKQLNQPELNLVLKEFEKPYIIIAGRVEHGGRYDFVENTTALQAIMLAGGFTAEAQQTRVLIFRKVNNDLAEVHTINLHKMDKTSDLERNMILEPGDMILVPTNNLEHVSRFVKALNLGIYFDPAVYAGR